MDKSNESSIESNESKSKNLKKPLSLSLSLVMTSHDFSHIRLLMQDHAWPQLNIV